MMTTDDRPKAWSSKDFELSNSEDNDVDMSIDLELFWDILEEESPAPSQNSPECLSAGTVHQGLPELERPFSVGAQLVEPGTFDLPVNRGASESGVGASDGSVVFLGNYGSFDNRKQEPAAQASSPASCSGSLSDWTFPAEGLVAGTNSFVHDFSSYGRDYYSDTHQEITNNDPAFCFAPEDGSLNVMMDKSNLNYADQFDSVEYSARISGKPNISETSLMNFDIPMQWDLPGGCNPQFISDNSDYASNFKNGWGDLATQTATIHSDEVFETQVNKVGEIPMGQMLTEDSNVGRLNVKCDDDILTSAIKGRYGELSNGPNAASQSLYHALGDTYSNKHLVTMKNENNNDLSYDSAHTRSAVNGFLARKCLSELLPSSIKNSLVHAKDEREDSSLVHKKAGHCLDPICESTHGKPDPVFGNHFTAVKALEHPDAQPLTSIKKSYSRNDEIVEEMTRPQKRDARFSEVSGQTTRTTAIVNSFNVDDDSEVRILEDPSDPFRSSLCSVTRRSIGGSQRPMISGPLHHIGTAGLKLKANDERVVFRVVLQDLSQPKSEASPPDGVLAVPLLRHQRIALSWMVQKETASLHCSGGILADDQGLGKTVSTIALILKERAPILSVCSENYEQNERETLNLDEDDDGTSGFSRQEQDAESYANLCNGSLERSSGSAMKAKGRPRAGTLVVCPTSVLRQWADELHNKVTCKAKLSVLVYHGSNRTKDPCELAKYDVVLTTYSIVSIEVPKQPLADKDDEETGNDESYIPSSGLSSCKKRKYFPTPTRSTKKVKKEVDCSFLGSDARPLARVGWFRIILDEAQSIKNHRTQVARACWGLRAKRRWCLSGTPIQNAVDDLYSYFRFLRYDPYATYKSFCSSIKIPINKNPTTGYKKLQAILKTVMLRRTKGTLLDGEPIIKLPPKSVELKKVDFTEEERDFYSRLEADSRAQFAKYAAAGTVKQNYVNILLMLLRLRQACDHPLLVSGYDSSSSLRSSVEMAKKLPREKQINLLQCLEASLALCGICNDPPEDAVVTSCGHVYCNQCICEHLTGDDNQCPTTNCRDRLSATSIFSKAALKCCLSQELVQVDATDCAASDVSDLLECGPRGSSFDSSKIKAALKVLESLCKPKPPIKDVAIFPRKSPDPFAVEEALDTDLDDSKGLVEGSKELVKVAGEKALVFSQWTRMLDLLETGLRSSSIQYRRLDGTMSVLARDRALKDFKTLPEVTVMIMSLKAASLGLNMVAACHVILLDLWWNPTTEDQAVDRAHRIGQTRPVSVLRLTIKDTVEDRILALQQKKREMVASAFGEDETGGNQTRLTVEDLKYLFMA